MSLDSFPAHRLGLFGRGLPTDRHGVVHLTAAGWASTEAADDLHATRFHEAKKDGETRAGADRAAAECVRQWAERQALRAQRLTAWAEERLAAWQRGEIRHPARFGLDIEQGLNLVSDDWGDWVAADDYDELRAAARFMAETLRTIAPRLDRDDAASAEAAVDGFERTQLPRADRQAPDPDAM